MHIGSDTGGTFTDLVAADGRVVKVASTPFEPGKAVREGLSWLTDVVPENLAHGTTVATNALLERRGARVALVATEGSADVIEIGRQDRPSLYDPAARRSDPLVPRDLRFEVVGRLGPDGAELIPIELESLAELPPDVEAVAVCLLHADIDPVHEQAVADSLVERGLDVCCSHEVSPEYREYERMVTTVINASLRPLCRDYLMGIASAALAVDVMASSGGLMPAEEAAELPAALLLSGPAGGVRAAAAAAAANGFPDAVTFDMGGTSTDVCLVLGGLPAPAAAREIAGFPVRFPALDVITIGAGGGSIAGIDPGGALVVGPRSAGAVPGPACYGRGGTEATVTDANLVAGRIHADANFGGLRLRRDLAEAALERAGVSADGVIAVVNTNMERALRAVTVERGVHPESVALVAFGGAGPLHACELAEALGIPTVIVPARAGVLSAVGILTAPLQRDLVRSWPAPWDLGGLDEALAALAREAVRLVGPGAEVTTALDCRYRGQSHELTVPDLDSFVGEHRSRNGYAIEGGEIEVVALRATAVRPPRVRTDELPPVGRAAPPAAGPAVIAERDCTIWMPEGWSARLGEAEALVLTHVERRGGLSWLRAR